MVKQRYSGLNLVLSRVFTFPYLGTVGPIPQWGRPAQRATRANDTTIVGFMDNMMVKVVHLPHTTTTIPRSSSDFRLAQNPGVSDSPDPHPHSNRDNV